MSRAYGSSATLLLKRETAYGTSPSGDYIRMPFNSVSLGSEQGLIDDPVLGQGRDPLAPLQDVINDEGDVTVPMDPRYLGLWLTGLFGEDLAPGVTTAVKELGSLANQASIAYEQLKLLAQGDFNFDGLSLGSTRSIVDERRAELQDIARELKELGNVGFMDDPLGWGRKVALERQLKEKTAIYQQWAAKLAWMQRDMGGKPDPKTSTVTSDGTADVDFKAAQARSDSITKLEKDLQRQLFTLTHQGANRMATGKAAIVAPYVKPIIDNPVRAVNGVKCAHIKTREMTEDTPVK